MTRNGTKESAEATLRELPSVLGASVREDINGHPREVHVLVRPVPSLRDLARDIRSLLEERLGVPIDQRVISIAQVRADAVKPPSSNGRSPAAERSPATGSPSPERRLRLEGIEFGRRDGRVTVEVRLAEGEREYAGRGTELETGSGRARAGAAAALAAATEACAPRLRLAVEHAAVTRAFERDVVLVSVLATGSRLGRRPITLVGAHQVEADVETAAALAALKAINRVLEPELEGASG